MSLTNFVPFLVPSLTHNSKPVEPLLPVNKTTSSNSIIQVRPDEPGGRIKSSVNLSNTVLQKEKLFFPSSRWRIPSFASPFPVPSSTPEITVIPELIDGQSTLGRGLYRIT